MVIHPPVSTKPVRTIVFSFDDSYAKYFSVLLLSLVDCADPAVLYDLIVLHNDLTEQTMESLLQLVPDSFSLRFFQVRQCAEMYFGDLSACISREQWTVAAFYDLLVPLLMPEYDRVLYCDSDMVFVKDPGELFETSFEGQPLIAVQDSLTITRETDPDNAFIQDQLAFLAETLGIHDPADYFNAGVMLFSIPAIDRDLWLEKVRTALAFPVLPTVDQDVLNYVLHGKTRPAPLRFNLQAQVLPHLTDEHASGNAAEWLEAAQDPVIIHYASYEKPWSWPDCALNAHFWYYAAQSPYYKDILQDNIRILQDKENLSIAKYRLASVLVHCTYGKLKARCKRVIAGHGRLFRLRQKLLEEPHRSKNGQIAFSRSSGICDHKERTVTLSAPEGCTIAYTTDGHIPDAANDSGQTVVNIRLKPSGTGYLIKHRDRMIYPDFSGFTLLDDPSLPSGIVLRAAAAHPDGSTGPVQTNVYFKDMDFPSRYPGCLVLSVVVDPDDLLDYDTGILAAGAFYDAWKETPDAAYVIAKEAVWFFQSNITQRGKAWERPCLVQIYDGGMSPAAEQPAGIRVTGNATRSVSQKSFNINFKKRYGSRFLDYELFPGTAQYKSFRLKNGGNNALWLKFKEAFLQEMVAGMCFTIPRSRPAVLFLNGEYWGPYLLSEKVTRWMLRDNYSIDENQVILIKEGVLDEGEKADYLLYQELMSYAQKDLADPVVWEAFCDVMDIRSFADYCAVRIYIGDADWAFEKNDLLWRTRNRSYNDGKWQYILYDIDYSSGLYVSQQTAVDTDHFRLALENYPLFASAMRNEEFRTLFLASLQKTGSECFAYPRVLKSVEKYCASWQPLMTDYYKRFGNTKDLWDLALSRTLIFFRDRYDFLLPLVEDYK